MAVGKLALGLFILVCLTLPLRAQDVAVARIDPAQSRIEDFGADLRIELVLSRPVPWQVYTLDAPRRLLVDFNEVDFSQTDLAAIVASDTISLLSVERVGPGWSRLVLSLAAPMRIETAGLATAGGANSGAHAAAVLKLQLAPSTAEEFTKSAGLPMESPLAPPQPEPLSEPGEDLGATLPGDGAAGTIGRIVRSVLGRGPDAAPDEAG